MSEIPSQPVEEELPDLRTDNLHKWSADKSLNPKDLGLTAEQAEKISQEFEQRALAETDVVKVIEGIIPKESLFNPDVLPNNISTPTGEVPVTKISGFGEAARNFVRKLFKFQAAAAAYSPSKSEIMVRPKLDRFSTTASIAAGSFNEVLGPSLAHEANHALQDIDQKPADTESTRQTMKRAVEMVKAEKGLSLAEAIALDGRSRDLAIITESQAYVLQYMLTGGNTRPDQITTLRDVVIEHGGTDPTKILVNNIPLTDYSEKGFASVVDYVEQNVKTYLPQKDQDSPDYLNRIRTATKQIVKLLAIGATHRQIADLVRENHQSLHGGNGWSEQSGTYTFLNLDSTDPLADKLPSDDEVIKKFNMDSENRVLKLSQIAKEAINKV